MSRAPITEMDPENLPRFLDKVEITDGCWLWKASTRSYGYGAFYVSGTKKTRRMVNAHRAAYIMLVGPIPDPALVVDHLCRNTLCVNPDHLELVTQAENIYRGSSLTAGNRVKTHCKRGHEFTTENTYVMRSGGRMCLACKRATDRQKRGAA